MKNFNEINRALWAKKKLFTLFLMALLGFGQVWAISKTQLTVNISGSGQIAVNTSPAKPSSWSSNSVTKNQGHGTFDITVEDTYYIWVNPNSGYYCSGVSDCTWDASNGYYTIKYKGSTGTTEKTVTATFVGNSYTLTFDGNGATSGSMSNQGFVYGTAKAISTNAFKREFAITYNANEGVCEETEATATATFAGWAKSSNGEVVYTDKQSLSTPTPIPAHNSTINLFAKWNAATVVLPEVSREGLLFDGWYNGDVWAGNIGDTYTATADAEITAHWAQKRTPVFVLDKKEIELDQTAVLTMNNVNNPSIEITPAGIVNYNAETGVLTGIGVGEVTITATQTETDVLSYKQEVLTLKVGKKTSSLSVFLNGVEQSSVAIYQGKTGTASFVKVSDAEVVVEAISGASCASYAKGVLTAGEIGTAVFRATLPETDTYLSTSIQFSVETQKDPIHLPMTFTQAMWNSSEIKVATSGTNSWDGDNQVRLGNGGSGGLDWDDKWITIHFLGIPDKLTFDYKYDYKTENTKNTACSPFSSVDPDQLYFLYIEESSDNSTWVPLTWQNTDPSSSWKSSGELQLKRTTRYLRFHLHANLGAYYRNIQISELKYVQDPDPASVDFGTAIIYTGEKSAEVNVNWCNVAPMSVTSTNPKFTVTPSTFANYDQYGSQQIKIAYEHTAEIGDFEGDIVISNGNETFTKTIHVHGETTKRPQSITWNAALATTGYAMNVGEQYPDESKEAVATVPSNERVTFTSLDPEIIEVIADTALLAKRVGTVMIAAYQAGDAEYAEAKDTVLFTVTDLRKQSITWEQNLYGLLTTDDSVKLTATATSGMEIVYTSANEDVVRIQNDTLIVVGEGETTITAYQAGGVDANEVEWLPINLNNYVIVRNPASQCNGKALTQASLVLGSSKTSQEYALSGIPNILTFAAQHGKKSGDWGGGVSYSALVVEQYAFLNGEWDWYTVFSQVVGTESDTQSGNISIDESAKKIRFATGETGTDHTISNIVVTRKKFMRADVENIDLNVEANAIWQQTITVSHSNIDLMSVSTKQGVLTLSANTLGKGCGDFGDDEFTASFTPKEKYVEYFDTIVITDGKAQPSTIEIPVRLYTTGLNQYIQNYELPAECITTTAVAPFAATATSGLEVIYLSSDSAVAYVENNQLVILAAGSVDITAYQAGDDKYNPASQAKTITIGLTPVEVLEAPTATEVKNGEALGMSKLFGGKTTVEGSFAWTNAALVLEESGNQEVTFTPVRDTYYDKATTMVAVTVTEQPTTYGEYKAQFCEGDSVEFGGKWYYAATTENILLEEKNVFGGDSIVILTVTTLPTYLTEEKDTVYVNTAYEWQDEYRNTNEVGTFNYKAEYKTVNNCDSIITLELVVIERPTTYGEYNAQFCEGSSVEFAGKQYFAATTENVTLEEKNIYGGDSIVVLTITALPRYLIEVKDTIYVGTAYEWDGSFLNTSNVGTINERIEETTVNGCDSIMTLELVIIERPTTYGEYQAQFCEGDSVEFAGKWYYQATTENILLEEKNVYGGDSIVALTVIVNPKSFVELTDTMTVGDIVRVEEAGWIAYYDTPENNMPLSAGQELALMSAEELYLSATLTNEFGCDSVVIRKIVVVAKQTPETPTAVESVQSAEKAVKVLRDGVIYIRREGKEFTTDGRLVK